MSKFAKNFLIILFVAVSCAYAQVVPADISNIVKNATAIDGNVNFQAGSNSEQVLANYMKDNWRYVLNNIDEFAPTFQKKTIILLGIQSLDPDEFFEYLEEVKKVRIEGKFNAEEFEFALSPCSNKQGFLELNYKNPQVRKYVEDIKNLVPADDVPALNDILSGKGSQEWREQLAADGRNSEDRMMSVETVKSVTVAATPSSPVSVPQQTPQTAAAETPTPQPKEAQPKSSDMPSVLLAIGVIVVVVALGLFFVRRKSS